MMPQTSFTFLSRSDYSLKAASIGIDNLNCIIQACKLERNSDVLSVYTTLYAMSADKHRRNGPEAQFGFDHDNYVTSDNRPYVRM